MVEKLRKIFSEGCVNTARAHFFVIFPNNRLVLYCFSEFALSVEYVIIISNFDSSKGCPCVIMFVFYLRFGELSTHIT